ncbi:MAG TPA: hypothetical protein VK741_31460, partial [Acetobacteraceae bacterium]|nr:hypothetical protein [Acetobacteraceae bacterium]
MNVDNADAGTPTLSKPLGIQSVTWETATRLVQDVEDAFGAADLARIAEGFTDDAVARFADFPEMHGRDAIMHF